MSEKRVCRKVCSFLLPERRLAPFLPPSGHGGQDDGPEQSGTEGVHPNPGTGPQGPIRSNRSNAAKVETLLQKPQHADTRQTNPEKHKRPATGRLRLTTKIRTEESAVRKAIRQKIRRQKTVRRGPGGESSRTANGFPEGTVRLLLRTMPEGVRNRTPVGRFRG